MGEREWNHSQTKEQSLLNKYNQLYPDNGGEMKMQQMIQQWLLIYYLNCEMSDATCTGGSFNKNSTAPFGGRRT